MDSCILYLIHTTKPSHAKKHNQACNAQGQHTIYIYALYTVFQKSDDKIQITITTAYLIRIKYPLSGFNYHPSDVNVATFNKIHRKVSEQQLF